MRNPLPTFSALTLAVAVLALPAVVSAKTTSTTTPVSTTPVAATTTAPATSSATSTTSTTTTTTAPATPAPAAETKAAPKSSKVVDIDDVSTSALSKGSIDVYMELTDNAKLDDALVGAESTVSDSITLVTVKDKKETEGNLRVPMPTGKTAKLTPDTQFLRISGIEKSLKDGDKFQLMLHFMRAPNATVDVTVHKKSGWF